MFNKKEENKITIDKADLLTLLDGYTSIERFNTYDQEFELSEVQELINQREFGMAGYTLMNMEDMKEAFKTAEKLSVSLANTPKHYGKAKKWALRG